MKLVVITCHNQPDYIRAVTLRQAALSQPNLEVKVVKNKRIGIFRYLEIMLRLIKIRLAFNPDVYLLTFRGYEILPFTKFISFKKKLIYDEFVNPIEWLNEPRDEFWTQFIPKSLFGAYYRRLVKKIDLILADTPSHAKYSAKLSRLPVTKYRSLPVGTDEDIFNPIVKTKKNKTFSVFYYGNMLPLHGLDTVLEAAHLLRDYPIKFLLIGGGYRSKTKIQAQKNKQLTHKNWLAFEALPYTIRRHHLCLGGPFGNTVQAQRVITGKTYQFLACRAPTLIGKNQASEIFKDGFNSLVVEQNNPHQLAKKILWAYKNQNKLVKIGQQGNKLYNNELSSKVISQEFSKILSDLG